MPNPGHRVNSGALDVRVKSVEVDNNEAKLMVDTLNVFNTNLTGGEGVLFIQASKASGGGYWFVTLFAIRGRAFATWPMIIYTAYAAAITIFFQIKGQTQITQNANMWSGLQTSVSLVGIALFFLQTFRTNSAYQRWWEGRCLWDSVNTACYSMARITQAGGISSKKHARRLLRWMCGYLVTLKAGLRDEEDISELYPILSNTELEELEEVHCTQRCVYTVQKITETWLSCQAEKKIGTASDKEFEKLVPDLMRCCGSMERIMHTPMPFAYITHLRSFLVIWLSVLPFIFMINLKYYTIGVCFVIAYALLGMEAISLEIESPFGRDFNDLPADNYSAEAMRALLLAYSKSHKLPSGDGDDGDGELGLEWEGKDDQLHPPSPSQADMGRPSRLLSRINVATKAAGPRPRSARSRASLHLAPSAPSKAGGAVAPLEAVVVEEPALGPPPGSARSGSTGRGTAKVLPTHGSETHANGWVKGAGQA